MTKDAEESLSDFVISGTSSGAFFPDGLLSERGGSNGQVAHSFDPPITRRVLQQSFRSLFRMSEKGGGEFKGASLHDSFGGFGGSGKHLALLSLVIENTGHRGNRDGF